MRAKISISFDDGLVDQFKWARALHHVGIVGTFYVCPFHVDSHKFLSLEQLKRMKLEWGHTIANHLWIHKAPKAGLSVKAILALYDCARKWLVKNGFEDGSRMVALPFGQEGGGWTPEYINALLEVCDQVRDYTTTGVNDLDAYRYVTANGFLDRPFVEGKLNLIGLHDNGYNSDGEFLEFLDRLQDEDVEVVSMLEIANVHSTR